MPESIPSLSSQTGHGNSSEMSDYPASHGSSSEESSVSSSRGRVVEESPVLHAIRQKGQKNTYQVARKDGKLVLTKGKCARVQRKYTRTENGEVIITELPREKDGTAQYRAKFSGIPLLDSLQGDIEDDDDSRRIPLLFGNMNQTRAFILTTLNDENAVVEVHIEISYPKTGKVDVIHFTMNPDSSGDESLMNTISFARLKGPAGNLFFTNEERDGDSPEIPSPYVTCDDQSPPSIARLAGDYKGKATIYPVTSGKIRSLCGFFDRIPWQSNMNYGFNNDARYPDSHAKLHTHFTMRLCKRLNMKSLDFTSLLVAQKEGHPDERLGQVFAIEQKKEFGLDDIIQLYVGNLEFNIHIKEDVKDIELFLSEHGPEISSDPAQSLSDGERSSESEGSSDTADRRTSSRMETVYLGFVRPSLGGKKLLPESKSKLRVVGLNSLDRTSSAGFDVRFWETEKADQILIKGLNDISTELEAHGLELNDSVKI
ncbi:hypothetical protein [Legionella spiritensis]|uniref:Uncharacterized protein n=1 Tax=Legionella spiritensis TaxID=452 RepID=A0A0W0Z676_LEGSP|nr:hypothetical protein [Legionella spiritensis]KTD64648.1 hypothetical protein Lspi_0815 [Legionella spiritensis]SNV47591.1 Uncharacterised protein [Legionella spiritensis]